MADPDDFSREPTGAATLTLELDGWEGPMDLLLALARAQKVDLRQISILDLVEQYLAFIDDAQALQLEIAADYLVMASWLALLKSALLLPRDERAEADPDEVAQLLQLRLERLAAIRDAGARLMARDRIGRDVFGRGAPEGLTLIRRPQWQVGLFELLTAYGEARTRAEPVVHVVADRPVMTLDQAIKRIVAMLGAEGWRGLDSFLPDTPDPAFRRSARASSFVAALELARQGRVVLRQTDMFAPLLIRAA